MLRKNRVGDMWWTLTKMLVALAALAVLIWIFAPNMLNFNKDIGTLSTPLQGLVCTAGASMPGSGEYTDCDGDGRPDRCDVCIDGGGPDTDGDGMQDACEQPNTVGLPEYRCRYINAKKTFCSKGDPSHIDSSFSEWPSSYPLTSDKCDTATLNYERTFEKVKDEFTYADRQDAIDRLEGQ